MGQGISFNYNIQKEHEMEFGYWRLYKGSKKDGDTPVTLWELNYPKLKARERDTEARHNYCKKIIESLKATQTYIHANILKIYEIDDKNIKEIRFSSERIKFPGSSINDFSRDEAYYASKQLAEVMRFLHGSKTAHFNLHPGSYVFTKQFQLKLIFFQETYKFFSDNQEIKDVSWDDSTTMCCPINYCPPELVNKSTLTSTVDQFMFGCNVVHFLTNQVPIDATKAMDYRPGLTGLQVKIKESNLVPEEFCELVEACVREDPLTRPRFEDIDGHKAFSSLISEIFNYYSTRYVLSISSGGDRAFKKEIYDFMLGLSDVICHFSERLKRYLFLPWFIKLLGVDQKFGIVVVPMIFAIRDTIPKDKIKKKIAEPLRPFFSSIANEQVARLILDKIDIIREIVPGSEFHSYVLPALYFALRSSQFELMEKAITLLPSILDCLSTDMITSYVVPTITDIIPSCRDSKTFEFICESIMSASKKVDHDLLVQRSVPKIAELWRQKTWIEIIPATQKMMSKLSMRGETLLRYVFLIYLEFLTVKSLGIGYQEELFNYLISNLNTLMKERGIRANTDGMSMSSTFSSVQPKADLQITSDPFQARVKSEQAPKSSNPISSLFNGKGASFDPARGEKSNAVERFDDFFSESSARTKTEDRVQDNSFEDFFAPRRIRLFNGGRGLTRTEANGPRNSADVGNNQPFSIEPYSGGSFQNGDGYVELPSNPFGSTSKQTTGLGMTSNNPIGSTGSPRGFSANMSGGNQSFPSGSMNNVQGFSANMSGGNQGFHSGASAFASVSFGNSSIMANSSGLYASNPPANTSGVHFGNNRGSAFNPPASMGVVSGSSTTNNSDGARFSGDPFGSQNSVQSSFGANSNFSASGGMYARSQFDDPSGSVRASPVFLSSNRSDNTTRDSFKDSYSRTKPSSSLYMNINAVEN